MKSFFLIFVASAYAFAAARAQTVDDPLADFLTLPIEDRYGEASIVTRVDKVSIDLNLDGERELLVGHHKMWLGDNENVYFAIYKKLPTGRYKRLTKPTEDVALNLRDGRPYFNFVGRIDELGETGLLICNPAQGDVELKTQRIESRVFISIAGDVVRVRELPGLDLTKESELSFYRKYFPQPGKQGGYSSESLKPAAIKALGLVVPDWTKAPIPAERSKSKALNETSVVEPSSLGVESKSSESRAVARTAEHSASTLRFVLGALIVLGIGLLWLLLKKRK